VIKLLGDSGDGPYFAIRPNLFFRQPLLIGYATAVILCSW